jgi:alpha-ketoglutarate-dependent taurine dioxygenase
MKDESTCGSGIGAARAARRSPVFLDTGAMEEGTLNPGCSLPFVIRAARPGVGVFEWARNNRDRIDTQLAKHGAVLFRNFGIETAMDFREFASILSNDLMDYKERSSPRTEVEKQVYTSTDYPATEDIFPHNEHSYASQFPLRLFFFCETAPESGGQTPIVDCRRVLTLVPKAIREKFVERNWMYVRNFGDGFGLSWQTAFQTELRGAVEEYCRRSGIEPEWRSGNRLRTTQVREVLLRHPRCGELSWFNHATFFHVSTLPRRIRESLLRGFSETDLPNNTYYGDGSPIEADTAESLRKAYLQEMVTFDWIRGDILLVDNMLTAHARCSYQGDRKILVIMADPVDRKSLVYA